VIISIADSTTELLCLPCYLKLASEILEAVVNPDNPDVMQAIKDAGEVEQARMNGQGPRKRGKNAPANTEDLDLIEAFDSAITVDELPEEFT
jgi:hypothetical protein